MSYRVLQVIGNSMNYACKWNRFLFSTEMGEWKFHDSITQPDTHKCEIESAYVWSDVG